MSWNLTRGRAWICVGFLVVLAVACEGGLLVVESGGAGGAGGGCVSACKDANGCEAGLSACFDGDAGEDQ
jgi:hypothetical protein